MAELKNRSPHGSKKGGEKGEFDILHRRVHFCMLFLAWEMHPFSSVFSYKTNIRGPPDVLHFKKNHEMEDISMSEWIKIRLKDFYKDAVGETEYTYVTREVYDALADTFRKEAHAQEMKDLRHRTREGYAEGETEDLMAVPEETLEDAVIRQIELEILQKAMQSLTEVQKERLHLYFFEGMTVRTIAEKQGVNRNAVWKSIQGILEQLRRYFEKI